jgi:hypothetical protein
MKFGYQPQMKIKIPIPVYCFVLFCLVSCQALSISPGDSPERVLSIMGEPTRTQDFLLPEAPFFGPQESLTGLIPAGALVKEWVYVQGDEETYVWFHCDQGEVGEDCSLIKTASYPVGAVY